MNKKSLNISDHQLKVNVKHDNKKIIIKELTNKSRLQPLALYNLEGSFRSGNVSGFRPEYAQALPFTSFNM